MSGLEESLKPRVAGTGLLAVDVVINLARPEEPKYFAGGTCGNVLAILSYLGWHASPVARLKDDRLGQLAVDELKQWGVATDFISRTPDGSTPVIIQKIRESPDGSRTHSFSLRCPCCNAYLPGYKPVLASDADSITNQLDRQQVFFFDRVSRGALRLAAAASENGAVIVFEPSGVGEPRLFREALSLAHIVKYSHERLRDMADFNMRGSSDDHVLLEVETAGAAGLRYRSRLHNASTRGWKHVSALPAAAVKDAAGSGDWCTAGIVHKLARGGRKALERASADRLTQAIRYGQALASWNCGFEGARGGMYRVTKQQFERQVRGIVKGKPVSAPAAEYHMDIEQMRKFCPSCDTAELKGIRKKA